MALNGGGGDHLEIEPDPATWTTLEENTFINIMANEVKSGNRHSTTFSKSSWASIEQEFYEKTNKRYNHSQFRNKYNQLRIQYIWFTKLLKEPGFTWDPVLRNAVATHDVWESYLKTNKKARRFRKKGFPMYDQLVIIFGNINHTIIDYKDAYPLAQYPCLSDEKFDPENESTNATPRPSPIDSTSTGQHGQNGQHVGQTRHQSQSQSPTSYLHINKAAKIAVGQGESMKETVSERTQMFKNSESSFSITNCVKCLESIQDVDAVMYIKAIKMFKDVDWREMFMAMSAQRRLDWLASLE